MPTMPKGLVPNVSEYSGSGPGGVMRAEVGGGSRYRVEWARGREQYNVSMILTATEFQVWSAFYHHIIKKGAVAFEMRLDSGLGVMPHTVHLIPGSYQASIMSGRWSIGFAVECESAVYALTDTQVAAYGLSAAAMPAGFVPTIASYSFGGPAGVMRDDVSGGAAGYALEWGRGPQQFSCTLILTPKEYSKWAVWFHRKINKGAQTFTMRLDSGTGTADHAATIIPGTYSTARTGGSATVVSFAVEAESKVYDMTADEAQSMINIYELFGDTSDALIVRLAQFATVDTLALRF